MAKYRLAAAVCAALSLSLGSFASIAIAQTASPEDDRPPLLSAPPPPDEAQTGAAAAARRTPAPAGAEPGTQTDFFSNAFTDYPPEVVPPTATKRPVTTEGSSAIK